MIRSARAAACFLASAFIAANIAGCSSKKPGAEDFHARISQAVEGYSVSDIRCETFASKDHEGSGRASCRGVLALTEDLYAPISSDELGRRLNAAGIPSQGVGFFRGRHARTIYYQASGSGAETAFVAECSYAGDVDGWRTGCDTTFDRHPGRPLRMLGGEFAVIDTPGYDAYIEAVMNDYRRLDAAYREVLDQVEAFFAVGRTVSSPHIRARITAPLVWSGDPGFLGRQGTFTLEQKYEDLRERPGSTFCGYQKGTPADDVRFSGSIIFNPRQSGEVLFTASLYMMDRVQGRNEFQSCGNPFRWNGTSWVYSFYSGNQLRSE